VVGDDLHFGPAGGEERSDPSLDAAQLLLDPVGQLRALLVTAPVKCPALGPGDTVWRPYLVGAEHRATALAQQRAESLRRERLAVRSARCEVRAGVSADQKPGCW